MKRGFILCFTMIAALINAAAGSSSYKEQGEAARVAKFQTNASRYRYNFMSRLEDLFRQRIQDMHLLMSSRVSV